MARLGALLIVVAIGTAACSNDTDATNPAAATSSSTEPSTTGASTTSSPTPDTAPAPPSYDIEVATINVLHGNSAASGCLPETDNCHAPTRLSIILDKLETEAGCPEIIALEETDQRWFEIVPEQLPDLCGGDYVLLTDNVGSPDQEMILTTLPVIQEARRALAGGPIWSAHWAQLDGGNGRIIDVFATHYASSSFNLPCGENPLDACSPSCPDDLMMGECHPIETLEFLDEVAAPGSLRLVIGDLNKEISDERIITLLDAGFIDTHTLAGNPECPSEGGPGCTSDIGGDTALDGLDLAEQVLRDRIDFILARPPQGCEISVDGQDTEETDVDGDGTHTGTWADTALAVPVEGLFWASDHVGIQADIALTCS